MRQLLPVACPSGCINVGPEFNGFAVRRSSLALNVVSQARMAAAAGQLDTDNREYLESLVTPGQVDSYIDDDPELFDDSEDLEPGAADFVAPAYRGWEGR